MKKKLKALSALTIMVLCTAVHAEDYVVIVNKKHPANALSKDLIKNIFMLDSEAFPDGSPALPIDHLKGSEQRKAFYQNVIEMSEQQVKNYYTTLVFTGKGRPPVSMASDKAIVEQVIKSERVMGYIRKSNLSDAVKVVYAFTAY